MPIVRYGHRGTAPGSEPPQVYGNTQIELAWTVVPLLIEVVLFLVTARYIWSCACGSSGARRDGLGTGAGEGARERGGR